MTAKGKQEAALRPGDFFPQGTDPTLWGERLILAADIGGIFVFAVEGALAAIRGEMDLLGVVVLSFVTALGGGIIRDVFLGQVPGILRVDICATAALAGSLIMIAGRRFGLPVWAGSLTGAAVCIALRLVSVSRQWNLPTVTSW